MIVKITNMMRIKDYTSILGNSVTIVLGFDDKPLLDDADACIAKKAMKGGKGFIIEDTTISIEDNVYNTVTDLDLTLHGKPAVWTTRIAYHSGYMIHYYEGELPGRIHFCTTLESQKYFFGDIFIPDGHELTLNEIEQEETLSFINARQLALKKLLMGQSYQAELIDLIPHKKLAEPRKKEHVQES